MENYDLPINASRIDYDQMIQLIKRLSEAQRIPVEGRTGAQEMTEVH